LKEPPSINDIILAIKDIILVIGCFLRYLSGIFLNYISEAESGRILEEFPAE